MSGHNGGGGSGAPGGAPGHDTSMGGDPYRGMVLAGKATPPVFQKTKSIAYGTSDEIYSLVSTTAVDAPSGAIPKSIEIKNDGIVPVVIMVGYKSYSDETTIDDSGATRYFHTMLMPNEVYYPSIRGAISTATATTQFDGEAIENVASSSVNSGLLWFDSTAILAAHVRPSETDPLTITVGTDETNLFRVGDLIQIGRGTSQTDLTEATYYREILRVQSITDGEDMVCERGLYGTDAGDYDETNWSAGHAIGQPVYLPFFNAYHDTDKYSVAQTDSGGKFKCFNFFGLGRTTSAVQGIVPGSVAIKFYNAGYQTFGLSGITSSTNSGLAASTEYGFDITVDGSGLLTSDYMKFTTDSSNLNFGGTNGVISKMQKALDDQYYLASSAIFEEKVSVSIVNGDIRFTSGQRLSTSAILLAAPSAGETTPFGVGRFPAIGSISSPVAATLPDDVLYDSITYATSPNTGVFGYDDGLGRLFGMCSGTINYETGAIVMTGCPPNAEFVYSASYNSAFSGKLTEASATRGGAIVNILANCPTQKKNASITLKQW